MRSGTHTGQALVHDHSGAEWTLVPNPPDNGNSVLERGGTRDRSATVSDRWPATVSPLANCIGRDALLAKHMLSLADGAQAAQSVELAARFVELALELLDEAYCQHAPGTRR